MPEKKRIVREATLQSCFREAIEEQGWLWRKFVTPARKNTPDCLVFIPKGRLVLVELKKPGENPTAAQCREHERYRKLGFDVHVIRDQVQIEYFIHHYKASVGTEAISRRDA